MSSIQSVAGQPVAAPDPMPMHHGVSPSATIWSWSVSSSSQVGRDLVAGRVKGLLRVPDQALAVEAPPQARHLSAAVRARHVRHVEPGLLVVFLQPGLGHELRDRSITLPCLTIGAGQRPGCGKSRMSGAVAGLHLRADLGLELLRAFVLDRDAGRFLERLDRSCWNFTSSVSDKGTGHADLGALHLAVVGIGQDR